MKQLLQLLPSQRMSATMLKRSPWHVAPTLAVLGPVGANAEPVAVWNGGVVVVNKLRKKSHLGSAIALVDNGQ